MKRIIESKSVLSEVMLPSKANPAGKVHGGEIMKMMDNCAGVTAMRHARTNVVTVRVDELVFYQSILVGQLVICESHLVHVGKTSMEVKVTVKFEDLMSQDQPKVALTAFFTFVSLDKDGKPSPIPGILIETEEEKQDYEDGKKRYQDYKKRKPFI